MDMTQDNQSSTGTSDVQQRIDREVKSSPIVMFVKGSREIPQCGFSKAVMDIFDEIGAEYKTIDVLSDQSIREGIKQYTNWPTIPQVFIHGEFIGGCDIVRDLFFQGELEKMVKKASGQS